MRLTSDNVSRGKLCKACRQMKSTLLHPFRGTMYCSAGCAQRAQNLFFPLPEQRSA